jgi:cyanate lyase
MSSLIRRNVVRSLGRLSRPLQAPVALGVSRLSSTVVPTPVLSRGYTDWNPTRPSIVGESTITPTMGGMNGNIAAELEAMGMKDHNFLFLNRWMITRLILAKKCEKKLTFHDMAKAIGLSEVFTTAAVLGQHCLAPQEVNGLCRMLGLDKYPKLTDRIVRVLSEPPLRGSLIGAIPTDPTIYRFYEILQVYGPTFKALIHEKCGDGIMSAVDLNINICTGTKQHRMPMRQGSWMQTMRRGSGSGSDEHQPDTTMQMDEMTGGDGEMMMTTEPTDAQDKEKRVVITMSGKFLPYKKY